MAEDFRNFGRIVRDQIKGKNVLEMPLEEINQVRS